VTASRDALSEQIGSLGVALKALESEKVKDTNTIDHLRESSEALQSQLDELMATGEKSEEFHKRMLAAEEEAAEKSRALAEAHDASSALQKRYEEAQNSLEINLRTIEDFTQRLDDNATVQNRLEDTLAQLAEYEQQLRAKDASLEAKNEIVVQLTKSEQQIQDLETKLRERNLEIRAMEDKLEAIAEAERTPHIDTVQLGSLKEEVEALNNALQATRSRLSTKERDFDELRSQVVELREARFRQSPVLQENRSISLGNAADVHETISRAMKLKRPDHVRAEALKRLEEERAKNADALAALKASVERYYS
jgi:chromosome segregation ATPase